MPSGVTVAPSNIALSAGQSQKITFSAVSYAATSTSSISVTGSSYGQSKQSTFTLQVTPYAGNVALSRTRYVRTDAVAPYTVFFDSATNRFFMSDPGTNQIFVLDAATRKLLGSIPVPGAYGIDETPDHSILYAGTQIGDVYAIDPRSLSVTTRYMASLIGPNGFQAYAVQAMADGELALLGGQGGIPSVDGYSGFAFWNPVNNSIRTYGSGSPIRSCADEGHIFALEATGDRSLLVLENQDVTGLTANEVCTIDPVTGRTNSLSITGLPVIPTPDGKSILVLEWGIQAQIAVLDAQTLSQTTSFPVGDFPAGTEMAVSPDSSVAYLSPLLGGIVFAYNISTGAQVGWLPDIYTQPIGTSISAIDNTGLLAGVNVEGIGFLDTAAMSTGPVGTAFLNGYLTTATGPITGGTSVDMGFPLSTNLAAVYFGQNLATSITPNPSLLYATTPPSPPGPVDVVSIMADGGRQILPEAFSYGPTILEVMPNLSTAEGGGTGVVYGYGFGPISPNYQIPQALQVTVGGQPAQITGFRPLGYSYGIPPTPIQELLFVVPPGTAGTASDVIVTSQSGTTTFPAAVQYLPPVQAVPVSGTPSIAQGIYDPFRDVYYFTDASQILVYSRTQNQWLTPIQVPAAPQGTTHRLWGIGLSPNGNNLAVADAGAGIIYLMNPTSPGAIKSFPFNQTYFTGTPIAGWNGPPTSPAAVAVSNSGMIYIASFGGSDTFFKLDTSSGNVMDYYQATNGLTGCAAGPLYKLAISSDNSTVFLNNDGMVFSIDTATDTARRTGADAQGCYGDYDLTLASRQAMLEATSFLYDVKLNAESYLTLNDRESDNISYVYGTQLSGDGALLFQPTTNGIDVFDGRVGTFRSRIALPFALSQNYDALVADGQDNVLIAITGVNGTGIAIVDLSSLSEPAPLPYTADAFTNSHANLFRFTSGGTGSVPQLHAVRKFRIPHVSNGIVRSSPGPIKPQ